MLTIVAAEVGLRAYVAAVDVEHGLYLADPHAQWITRPHLRRTIDHDDPPLHFVADTNSIGLRGTAEIGAHAPGEHRVLVLGDSFTWGIGVASEETFPVLLEQRLRAETARPVTVVNGGMPSYGTAQELGFYRGYADRLEADSVVLAYYANDDGDNASRWTFSDGFLWQDPLLFRGHPSFVIEFARAKLLQVTRRSIGDGHRRSLALIDTLRRECARDGRLLIVLQLTPRESTRFRLEQERAQPYHPLEIDPDLLVEMRDEVEAEPESPYLLEHHFSPRGHEIAADVLARALAARAAVPHGP